MADETTGKEGADVTGTPGYKKWLAEVQAGSRLFRDGPDEFITAETCLIAVQKNGYALQYVPENCAMYPERCMTLIKIREKVQELYRKDVDPDDGPGEGKKSGTGGKAAAKKSGLVIDLEPAAKTTDKKPAMKAKEKKPALKK